MILRSLYELARREHLTADLDFPLAPVAWLVTIGPDGSIRGVADTRTAEPSKGKRAPKMVAKNLPVPRPPGRTSGDRANFFVDNSEYAFGLTIVDSDGRVRAPEKVAARFALFRHQIRECAAETADHGAAAVLLALDGIAAGRQSLPLPRDCASNDLFAFVYEPDIDTPVHLRPAIQGYWRRIRQGEVAEGDPAVPAFTCMITGESVREIPNFPLVKRVPGGQPSGASLVSFNASAFESYGLSGNENAPISRGAAEAAATALRRLLDPAFPDPRPEHQGERLSRRHVRLGSDTAVCYWSSSEAADEFLNAFGPLLDGNDPAEVGEMFRSVWRGRPAPVRDTGAFYALTLSGASGRIIIRDWLELPVAGAASNLSRHFADLAIVRNTPTANGREPASHLPLHVLLSALAPMGKRENVPSSLAADLVSAALRGTRYPVALLQRAVERARAEIGNAKWGDLERRDARAAIIKAVLIRTFNHELPPSMDPTNRDPGYLCGRLMAIIERLQQIALDDINASVVDRYFGAASATPRAVFVRLLRGAQHHARKALDEPARRGSAMWLKRQIDEISSHFDPGHNGFPAFLNLEQQGLFILGYHQQRHALWSKRGTDAAEEAPESVRNTPAA